MSDVQSNIFEAMKQDAGFWGDLSEAHVEVLEGDAFIARYTDTVALGDTVMRGVLYCGLPTPVYQVRAWSLDTAIRVKRSFAEIGGEDPDAAEQEAMREHESRSPISREEAVQKVDKRLVDISNLEVYEGLGRLRRIVEFAKFARGKQSRFIPHFERPHLALPGIITIKVGGPEEIVIDRNVDEAFKR